MTVGPYDPSDTTTPNYPIGTRTEYDALGRVVKTSRWANVEIQVRGYNAYDDSLESDDPTRVGLRATGWTTQGNAYVDGSELSYSRTVYDCAGRVALSIVLDDDGYEQPTGYKYDLAGRQVCVADAKDYNLQPGDYHQPNGTFYELTQAKIDDLLDTDIATLQNTSSTTYEGTRRKSVTDDNDNTTSFEYDGLGRVIKTIHPPTDIVEGDNSLTYTHVGYDGLGRKFWQSEQTIYSNEPGDLVPADQIRTFEYDAAGRLIATILPPVFDPNPEVVQGHSADEQVYPRYEYKYDPYGNQIEIWDNVKQYANGDIIYDRMRLTLFTYDEQGRQTSRTLPNGKTEYTFYDDFGRLFYHEDFEGRVTGYDYNDLGQLQNKYYYDDGADDPDQTVTYAYDNLGRRITVTDARGDTDYFYDAEGRVIQIDSPEGTIYYEYSPITGRKTRTYTDDGDVDSGYEYDDLGRLAKVKDQLPNPDTETEYDYNAVGSRQSIKLDNGAYTYYDYDNCNRLIKLRNFEQYEANPQSPTVATLSSFAYTLYADGMRSGVTEAVEKPDGTNETHYLNYGYDNLNRVIDESAHVNSDGTGYGYDTEYTYNLVGNRTYRLVTVTNSSGVQELHTKYDYDPATDRLNWEKHRDEQIAMAIPYGNETLYAYADSNGKVFYKTASGETISSLRAFGMGLPTKWNRYALITAWLALGITMLLPLLSQMLQRMSFLRRACPRLYRGQESRPSRAKFGLFTRGVCLLLVFLFILGPNEFNTLAQADILYENLDTSTWATVGTTIEYEYDDNGSLIKKTTWDGDIDTGNIIEEREYVYNLQNRLAYIIDTKGTSGQEDDEFLTEYRYNDEGVRVAKVDYTGANPNTTLYLIDSANHTGYAQVIAELTYEDTIDPDPETDTPDTIRSYTIGDDVIAQSDNPGTAADTEYLLYDGHGSTRQVTDYSIDSSNDIIDSYSYDAYGMMLGGNPTTDTPAATNLLYTGEQFDTDLQQYYLRARYYDPSNGRFNRLDPYAGNNQDPQSLHKYLYCHNNPTNGIDPTGNSFTIAGLSSSIFIMAILFTISATNYANAPSEDAITFPDTSGDMVIDCFIMIGACAAIRYVIAPVFRTTIRHIGRGLHRIKITSPSFNGGPGVWTRVKEVMQPRAAQYQTHITGQPVENAYITNGVKFDGL